VRQWHLRFIAFFLLSSWAYDLVWLFINTGGYWSSQIYDGDVELGLRRFAIMLSYFMVIFKIIYFLVFWKVSVEYNRFFSEDFTMDGFETSDRKVFSKDVTPQKKNAVMMNPYQP